ncbi:transcriptional regulator of sugar metabolism [Thioflavicoccus mobilis 8321]|uniref:Transcriptional regulator of sugar metabolism n=1 Tax=Thioflavicoccus mobilis 8321 TaxID=765912 RepID=L0GZ31_9GAMM|nr:FeoC-like transcriptional regulator [Thioflavicoccus mobilis]AGA90564.1 transcriptional regulator of sugar metabolism [Thioflavicoccus mobilis 8321]
MILSDLTTYLSRHQRVALMDLSHRFDSTPDALRGMLAALERKGRVRRVVGTEGCRTGCCQCDPATFETYEWLGDGPTRQ